MAGNTSVPGVSVASRVLALLDAFDPGDRCLTLSELARRANLPLPTAHRLVSELTSWGALVRQPSGQYVIGRRVWELGLLAPDTNGFRQLASPFLHDMYATTLVTTVLAVRDGTEAVNVDRLSGRTSLSIESEVGSRVPLYATAVGKVLLAYAPSAIRAEVLAHLERLTAYTITQPGRLEEQLTQVRRDGFAQSIEEMKLGVSSVAVPIRLADRSVVGSLGAVVSNLKRDRPRLIAALSVAAQGISRCIGQHPVAI